MCGTVVVTIFFSVTVCQTATSSGRTLCVEKVSDNTASNGEIDALPSPCQGCRAYACQCLWRSVTGVEELGRDGGKGEGGGGRGEKGEERRRRGRGEKVGAETCPPLSSLKWVCRRHFTD